VGKERSKLDTVQHASEQRGDHLSKRGGRRGSQNAQLKTGTGSVLPEKAKKGGNPGHAIHTGREGNRENETLPSPRKGSS